MCPSKLLKKALLVIPFGTTYNFGKSTGTSDKTIPVAKRAFTLPLHQAVLKKTRWIGLSISFGFFSLNAQTTSKYIVTDQFGYLPDSQKIAVIRDPKIGFDAAETFVPGPKYALVSKETGKIVFTAAPVNWNDWIFDLVSGDKIWWFDFSSVTKEGEYYILDKTNNVKSFDFEISGTIYNEVLKQAMRSFYYQRAGFSKTLPYAEKGWTDAASFVGPLQDTQCRIFSDPDNPATQKDLHGGWYDAGDLHRYTIWEANYVVGFMHTYLQRPDVWPDDYGIPESGNGIPDLLDEAKWGLDHLLRLQNKDGGVISLVGVDHNNASPPSKATGRSLYIPPSTASTLSSAGAFAAGARVFRLIGMTDYADSLQSAAIKAWDWSIANPAVLFKNNDAGTGTLNLGSGQQEVDDYGRFALKMRAACFLYEITGDTKYKMFFESNYGQMHTILWSFVSQYAVDEQETLLHYASLAGSSKTIASEIKSKYKNGMVSSKNYFQAYNDKKDPYRSYIEHYGWGSNSIKSCQGLLFTDWMDYDIDPKRNKDAMDAAEGYIHYIHGVNPFNMVYMTNMGRYGAEKSVTQIYHTWFTNGSPLWDEVGVSTFGPPPGFVPGGPNQDYKWSGCCNDMSCGAANPVCNSEAIPLTEPPMKFYKDFNTSWPLDSWEITENSCGYQVNYIHLLSKYAKVVPSKK